MHNADNSVIREIHRNLITSATSKIHIPEAFNGSYFFQFSGQIQENGISGITRLDLAFLDDYERDATNGRSGSNASGLSQML